MALAIIQARLGSTRLPGKVMLDLLGKTVLQHIIERVQATRGISKTVIAMTDRSYDDQLREYVSSLGIEGFRGSENDVLDRFYQCALKYKADTIVRVTADDPLKDPSIIELALSYLAQDPNLDYCSNTIEPSYPEGLDIEVFRFSALKTAWEQAKLLSDREHVTPFIWRNSDKFKTKNFFFEKNLSHWRWTLDKAQDFEFINKIYKALYNSNKMFSYLDVIRLIEKNPEWLQINSNTVRNEGYLKSLEQDGSNHG